MERTVIAATLAVIACASPAHAYILDWPLYSPVDKVVCDANYKFCADGTGVSATWTELFFGYGVAKSMYDMDQSQFTFSDGVECSTLIHSCWGGPDNNRDGITRVFGW